MIPVLWFASLASVLLVQPWVLNGPSEENGLATELVFNPADLKFLEYENAPINTSMALKDTLMVLVAFVFFILARWQWMCLKKEEIDIKKMFANCDSQPIAAEDISNFFNETEKLFKELEKMYKLLNKRHRKLDQDINHETTFESLKDDIEFVQSSWNTQFSTFSLLDVQPVEDSVGDWGLRMDLFDLQEKFDADIAELDGMLSGF